MNTCKYFTYRKYVSYDNGNTWSPTSEVHRGMLIERDSTDCGGGTGAIFKWVVVEGDYTCQGYDKYEKTEKYVSYDNGETWEIAYPIEYGIGALIESQSEDCGYVPPTPTNYKLQATYSDSSTYNLECDSTSAITAYDVQAHAPSHSAMTSAVIGDCVTSIGNYAFQACRSLSSLTIGSGVTTIGDDAFEICSALTSVELPNSITSIGESAFYYCTSLSSVTLGNGITSINRNTFGNCNNLVSINIPNNVTSVGVLAFNNCYSLSSITLPNSIISIGNFAFDGCHTLTNINIPSGVTSIGNGVFASCSGLTSIDIHSGVTAIGTNAFNWCSSLSSITVNATIPPTLGEYTFNNTNDCPIYVPCASVDAYKAASGWSEYASRIQGIPPCGRLPQGYTELEYVRHSTNLSNTKANCFAVQCDTTSGNVYTCIMKYEANNMYDYFFGNSAVSLEREQISTIHCCYYDYRDYQQGTFTNNVKQTFVLEPRTLKVYDDNGTLQQTISLNSGSKPYTAETTFGLMSAYKDDATMMKGNLYYFSVEDANGVLKNEFIPCKRDSDNKVGVYDLVNDVFYSPTAFELEEPM